MIYFLSSLPRSGSTLLASLLGQRDDTYVSQTSNLGNVLGSIVNMINNDPATEASGCTKEEQYRILSSVIDAKYAERSEEVIFDKGRVWPSPLVIDTLIKMQYQPIKIVATVRPVAECLASFYKIDDKKTPSVDVWLKTSDLVGHFMDSYQILKEGYEKYPDNFCLVEYDDLCNSPQRELDRISDFLGVDRHAYDPHISQVNENDNAWHIPDLHTLAPTIENLSQEERSAEAKEILGEENFNFYQGGEFWNDNPEPVLKKKPLDLSLELGLHGKFKEAETILRHELSLNPTDNRVLFNLGIYELMKGNLSRGYRYLDHGRGEEVFGSRPFGSDKPLWSGERDCTVLLKMEGGFGDQFHCLRFAKLIAEYGCRVVIGGCLPLSPIMRQVEGVSAIVRHEAVLGVDYDYWVPAMSSVVPLGLEYSDLSGEAYIPLTAESENKIGIKWSGNPEFEHQQHRLFPSELMFKTVNDEDCICLQKECGETDGLVPAPDWMEQPSLETWSDAQKQISRCSLVITSCTGLAHLAGAMGVETWIIIPILPYYLWASPGNKTPYYDSVTLFRQEKHGCWEAPFKKIKQALIARRVQSWNQSPVGKTTQQFIEA